MVVVISDAVHRADESSQSGRDGYRIARIELKRDLKQKGDAQRAEHNNAGRWRRRARQDPKSEVTCKVTVQEVSFHSILGLNRYASPFTPSPSVPDGDENGSFRVMSYSI